MLPEIGAAGLHFLGFTERVFRPLVLALGVVLAGLMANQIFYAGAGDGFGGAEMCKKSALSRRADAADFIERILGDGF